MTTFTQEPSEDDVFTALRAFLQDVLPPQQTSPILVRHVVIVGQENRVPEPTAQNYVVMTPLRLPRLSTNYNTLATLGVDAKTRQSAQVVIQLDVHGPEAFDNCARISTLFRDGFAYDFFQAVNPAIAPLFADDPRQVQFVDGEKQYEDRWIVEANLQVNFTLTRTTESARALTLDIIDVETDPADWPNSTASASP